MKKNIVEREYLTKCGQQCC